MGPAADEYFQRCVRETLSAPSDQMQMSMVVLKNNRISDRTAALSDPSAPSPVAELLRTVRDLSAFGVSHIVWPCNTAHAFLPEVLRALPADDARKILNMVTITVDALPAQGTALLATHGTLAAQVYHRACVRAGKELAVPDAETQQKIHASIYEDLKKGDIRQAVPVLLDAVKALKKSGATHMLLGCTELPLAYEVSQKEFDALEVTYIDPMRFAARAVVQRWNERLALP